MQVRYAINADLQCILGHFQANFECLNIVLWRALLSGLCILLCILLQYGFW